MIVYELTDKEHEFVWECISEMTLRWKEQVRLWEGNDKKVAYFQTAHDEGEQMLRKIRNFDPEFRASQERIIEWGDRIKAMIAEREKLK